MKRSFLNCIFWSSLMLLVSSKYPITVYLFECPLYRGTQTHCGKSWITFSFRTLHLRETLNGAIAASLVCEAPWLAANLLRIRQTLLAPGGPCCHLICPGCKELCAEERGLEQWRRGPAWHYDITMAQRKQGGAAKPACRRHLAGLTLPHQSLPSHTELRHKVLFGEL